jgi:hypothetical protein
MLFKNYISVYVWCRFYICWSHKRTVQFTVLYGGRLSYSCWSSCRNITPWMLVHKWWCVRRDSWWSMFRRWCLMTSLPHQGVGGRGGGARKRPNEVSVCDKFEFTVIREEQQTTQFPLLGWTALDVNRLSLRSYFPFRMSCSTANNFP